ncbi:MAG: DNA polymerase III subunit beta [bacterium]
MKLQVIQENLNKALSFASRFASPKAQLPVLGNILLSAKKTKLLVAATNLEVSISVSLGAQIASEGDLTVPARTIVDLVSNLPPSTVNLETDKERLEISCPGFSSKISGINALDFPSIPSTVGKTGNVVLPKKEFLESLSQVSFSTSSDETRPILTGVLFIFGKGYLQMVATDGFRLSQKKIKLDFSSIVKKLVLPKTALLELSRIGEDQNSFDFSFNEKENQVLFGFDGIVLSSRVLEGDFPPYEKIIPKSSSIKIRADREDLLRAVKLAAVFARDSANVIKISLGKDSLQVSAESSNSGSQKTKVEAAFETAGGAAHILKDFEIAFNYRFLEDFLKAVRGEEVNMDFSSPNAPGVFTDPKDPDYLHLIMPVKIQG